MSNKPLPVYIIKKELRHGIHCCICLTRLEKTMPARTEREQFRNEDWLSVYCKSEWAADTPMETLYVSFTTKLWRDGIDLRLVLILRSIMREEKSQNKDILFTLSHTWLSALIDVKYSAMWQTVGFLSLIISDSHFLLPPQSFTSSLSLLLLRRSTPSPRSSSHHRLKRGWLFFHTTQPNSLSMNYALCH